MKFVVRVAYNARDVNRSSLVLSSPTVKYHNTFTGMLLREDFRKWQSPLDPSTNHNIASNLLHAGTAEWFFDGNVFEEWKEAGSLLWIHGRRSFFLPTIALVI